MARIQRVIDADKDILHVRLSGIIDGQFIKSFVNHHSAFNSTIFKTRPFDLENFSDVTLTSINITNSHLVLRVIVSFPILKEDSLFTKYDVLQVGFRVIEGNMTNKSSCANHILPDQVVLYNSFFYELNLCQGLYPYGICRIDLHNLLSRLSCFQAGTIRCPQYPFKCSTANYLSFRQGLLLTTNSTVLRDTDSSNLITVEPKNGSALFIPWHKTRSVIVGDRIHYAPEDQIPTSGECSSGSSSGCSTEEKYAVYDVDLKYRKDDVRLLEWYGFNTLIVV